MSDHVNASCVTSDGKLGYNVTELSPAEQQRLFAEFQGNIQLTDVKLMSVSTGKHGMRLTTTVERGNMEMAAYQQVVPEIHENNLRIIRGRMTKQRNTHSKSRQQTYVNEPARR